jgi:hypothetical protein
MALSAATARNVGHNYSLQTQECQAEVSRQRSTLVGGLSTRCAEERRLQAWYVPDSNLGFGAWTGLQAESRCLGSAEAQSFDFGRGGGGGGVGWLPSKLGFSIPAPISIYLLNKGAVIFQPTHT